VTPPSVGIALLAAGSEPLVRTSVLAVSETVSRLESAGIATTSVVVDRTTDPGARALVRSLRGGTILDSESHRRFAESTGAFLDRFDPAGSLVAEAPPGEGLLGSSQEPT
jgi:hypothetical protein